MSIMPESDGEDINKFKIVVQWAKNKLTKFRTDERRKVKLSLFLLYYYFLVNTRFLGLTPTSTILKETIKN